MTQPAFVPKPGQVDYTNIRYAPVVNSMVTYKGKLLLLKRSPHLRLYPNCWNGVSGFLDDNQDIEDKVREELREELGLDSQHVARITVARPLRQEAPEYGKTWIVFPVLVEITSDQLTLDWESETYAWFTPEEAKKVELVPNVDEVMAQFF